jgi:Zn-dependent M28 family amino/carboxypeptidase
MGALGDIYYPGANDNASGVAVVLSLARYYSKDPAAMSLVFCFFTGEEQGLYGSEKYVKDPLISLDKTMMVLNLDMVGSGHEGWGIVAGKENPKDMEIFEKYCAQHELGKLKNRSNKPNSDHFPFTRKGVKAMFFYASGGKQPYHHPDDIPETLDWDVMENLFEMIRSYISEKTIN